MTLRIQQVQALTDVLQEYASSINKRGSINGLAPSNVQAECVLLHQDIQVNKLLRDIERRELTEAVLYEWQRNEGCDLFITRITDHLKIDIDELFGSGPFYFNKF